MWDHSLSPLRDFRVMQRCGNSGYSEVQTGEVSLARVFRLPAKMQLLTTAQAAAMLGVHPNTIRNWSDTAMLPTYRIGPRRDRRFKRDDLERFLNESNCDNGLSNEAD